MKSCLKSPHSPPRRRRVSFGENNEVFEVENWDRTPTDATFDWSYDDLCELEEMATPEEAFNSLPEWPSSIPIELFPPYNISTALPAPPVVTRKRARFYAPRFASQTRPVAVPPRFAAARRCPASTFKAANQSRMIINGVEVAWDDDTSSPTDSDYDFLQHGRIPLALSCSPSPSPPSSPTSSLYSPSDSLDPFAARPAMRLLPNPSPASPRLELAFDPCTYSIMKVHPGTGRRMSAYNNNNAYANPSAGHAYVSVPS
ncbi:hypothetical protein C8F01DRAFT_1249017 [Mycena amicta]|nr:hypothetical protein C8F01DRAFT_1249017 [Mycena amicta]